MTCELFQPVAALMREAARTITIPAQQDLLKLQRETEVKDDGSYVTKADKAAEAFLAPALVKLLPGSKALGEETINKTFENADAPLLWVIDPIDGTFNFRQGKDYGIMIALLRDGKPDAAWIYYPRTNDMLFAAQGQKTQHVEWKQDGSYTSRPVSVPATRPDQTHLSYYVYGAADYLGEYAPLAASFDKAEICRCIATDTRDMVLTGSPMALLFPKHFTLWDFHPTAKILEQAGGSVVLLPDSNGAPKGGIYATDPAVMRKVLQTEPLRAAYPALG